MTLSGAAVAVLLFSTNVYAQDGSTAPKSRDGEVIESESFRLQVAPEGITSLKRVNDVHDTDYIGESGALGRLVVRYRTLPAGDWTEVGEVVRTEVGQTDANVMNFRLGGPRPALETLQVNQRFELNDESLDWTITLRNESSARIEVGDLGVPLQMAERTPGNRGEIYTQKLLRHSYVGGHGSWIYWHRANAVGPYLVMTTRSPQTKLEYFESGGSNTYTPYIHGKVASAEAIRRGGTWRLPVTSLELGPDEEATYSFRFLWAPDVPGVRDVLYAQNEIDTVVVPGMAITTDLPAWVMLRTKLRIDAVVAEHEGQTEIDYVGENGYDTHVYRVRFEKLGENMLTVMQEDGQWTSLEFFVMEPVETLIKKRAAFLVNRMQHSDPSKPWYGGYGDWDQINQVLRNPEDRDGLRPWLVDSSDDAGNARPAYIAAKNVFYPVQEEIDSVERYIRHYLWNDLKDGKGGMQMTENEEYPYGIYGTFDNWWGHRQAAAEPPADYRPGAANRQQQWDRLHKDHLWRIYDYPHIMHLYFRMYQIGTLYPDMLQYKNPQEYLELAYRTSVAYWTVPMEIERWSANSVPTMNEAFVPELIDALEKENRPEWADTLRAYWESKVVRFINRTPNNLFGSEFAFDSTGFESTQAFAKYAAERVIKPGEKMPDGLPEDDFRRVVSYADAKTFHDFQMRLNIGDRGWIEPTYYQLGSDYRGGTTYLLSYMSHLGGWGVLDEGLHFAADPTDYLRLGYASALSAWALMNTGTAESGYGYWFPAKENDGATGGGFMSDAIGRAWIGKEVRRGAWHYSAEEDVGYVGALRTHATILTKDPVFGDYAYGAISERDGDAMRIIPRDGLRTRLHVIRDDQRLHMILTRDGYAEEQPILIADDLSRIQFTLENRGGGDHDTGLEITGLPPGTYRVQVGDRAVGTIPGGPALQEIRLPIGTRPHLPVTISKTAKPVDVDG